jgi:transposase
MESPPESVVPECARCRELEARLLDLETKYRDLEDRLKALTTPPAKRPVSAQPPAPGKTPTGKTRGGQPGHQPHLKKWLPRERVTDVVTYVPERCGSCDAALPAAAGPADPAPTIHQVAEVPPLLAHVTEYQGHSRTCPCGHVTHAPIPAAIRAHSVGPHLTAAIVYFAGSHGMSKRGIEETVETLFGVPIAVGTIANLEQEASAALEPAYREVRQAVASAPVKHLDETGWKEAGKKRWLWVAATARAVLFLIHPRRNLAALKLLLGNLSGVLVSDRWCVYDDWDFENRQLCWAHVKRNWDKQIERGGKAKELGNRWQAIQKQVFELWHRFRGGGCTRAELSDRMVPHVEALGDLLLAGTRSRDARLARYCTRLRDRFPLLWLFVSVEGVEPTNNHAERVQRRAVLWRKKSFGCHSPAGCRFVERILTVIQTLRLQNRNALAFLGETLARHRQGHITPLLGGMG